MDTVQASKQIGEVSYFADSLHTLVQIIDQQLIAVSAAEYDTYTKQKRPYVSLSRNLTAPATRNSRRWKCGVVLDGTKLSNRYEIKPVSYAGYNFHTSSKFKLKSITAYDDNTYRIDCLNWTGIYVPKSVYEEIKLNIETLPDSSKDNLEHQGRGKRPYRGKTVVERYVFTNRYGGPALSMLVSDSTARKILSSPRIAEFEERLFPKDNQYVASIANCILGVVLSEADAKEFELNKDDESSVYCDLHRALVIACGPNFKVIAY